MEEGLTYQDELKLVKSTDRRQAEEPITQIDIKVFFWTYSERKHAR